MMQKKSKKKKRKKKYKRPDKLFVFEVLESGHVVMKNTQQRFNLATFQAFVMRKNTRQRDMITVLKDGEIINLSTIVQ